MPTPSSPTLITDRPVIAGPVNGTRFTKVAPPNTRAYRGVGGPAFAVRVDRSAPPDAAREPRPRSEPVGRGAVRHSNEIPGLRTSDLRRAVGAGLVVLVTGCASAVHRGPASLDDPGFPWPPPSPTASDVADASSRATPTLGALADALRDDLGRAGFTRVSLSEVPGGFALSTDVRSVEHDAAGPRQAGVVSSLVAALRGALLGRPGRYRAFAFVATDTVFRFADRLTAEEAAARFGGAVDLPGEVRSRPFSADHKLWVLVYEFRQRVVDGPAELFLAAEPTTIDDYLRAAGISRSVW